MDFLPEDVQAYAEKFTTPPSEVLKQLDRETHLKVLYPRMLSGHIQGSILSFISKMIRPKTILEIGTYTGYSAICMAEGLAPGGRIHTLEKNHELEDMIRSYFEKAGVADRIDLYIGDAAESIEKLDISPDLVFIDADKQNYKKYYQMVKPKMPSGGIILADNVLWSGNVLKDDVKDKETEGLRTFTQYVHEDPEVENLLLPVRDGIMIVRKL